MDNLTKELLESNRKRNLEASVVIQKNYRRVYNSKNWDKIKISIHLIRQRIRVFLASQKKVYLQKILPLKKILKKHISLRNYLKIGFHLFKKQLSTYYKGFSLGERVILVESTRIREIKHEKGIGIIHSFNSERIREKREPIFVKKGNGGIYQFPSKLCRVY